VKVEKLAEVQPVEAAEVEEESVEVAEPTEIPAERVQPSKVRRCAECFTLACTQHDAITDAKSSPSQAPTSAPSAAPSLPPVNRRRERHTRLVRLSSRGEWRRGVWSMPHTLF
jgi:hypothetical protein